MEQYIGKLKKKTAESGKEYFKGFVGNVPVVGFWGHKEPDAINLKLDVSYIDWKDKQEKPEEVKQDESLPF